MKFSDETLMAYADNELDPQTRAALEEALASDPELARRVARHRALRSKLRSTYDRVLDEPVPDRLLKLVRSTPAARHESNVIPLRRKTATPRWSWAQWGAIAASVGIGVIAGQLMLRTSTIGPIVSRNGQLLASGTLAQALSNQLASEQPRSAPVQIGVSFRSKEGEYCRTFVLRNESALAGLACHAGSEWRLQVLAENPSDAGAGSQYRPAGSALPREVLQAIDERIAGEPLDAHAEAAARGRNWSRQP